MAKEGSSKRRVAEALRAGKATELQARMAWILYAVNGVENALEFIAHVTRQKATEEMTAQAVAGVE